MDDKRRIAEKLYKRIQTCKICPQVNTKKVARKVLHTNLHAEVMIIAEAVAEKQVRLSGINYFLEDGTVGNTGKQLEKFLNKLGYSVYPESAACIYHTEIVHCFPGHTTSKKGKRSIKRPDDVIVGNCLDQNYLEQELQLINPKVILLMGKTAYETFYTYILNKKVFPKLTQSIEQISKSGAVDLYNGVPLFPIQHASGANPRFHAMLDNESLIKQIYKYLHVNHSVNRRKLLRAIELSRSRSTCYPPYQGQRDTCNPALGQCYVTALTIHDYLGGDIIKAISSNGTSHYWNRIDGEEIDLTKGQFEEDESFTNSETVDRTTLQENERYNLLRKTVTEKLQTPY